ncbi:MAG TPA: hypothetical protein VGD81_11680 [Opitutaceae bacterium]
MAAALAVAMLCPGCLSAAVARAAGRGREVLKPGTPREALIEHFGRPEQTAPDWIASKAQRETYAPATSTIWKIRGRPAQVDDGGGQATVSALTLGVGEVVLLPMTLLGEGSDALKTYYLIGIFDASGKLTRHYALENR